MRLRAAALLLAVAVAACATKPPPPVAPTQAEWDAVSAQDFTCKMGEFVSVDFEAAIAAPDKYFDRCLRLRALLVGDFLVANAASFNMPLEPGQASRGTIGVYLKDGKLVAGMARHPQFAVIEGRLRSCAARLAAFMALDKRRYTAELAARKPGDTSVTEDMPALTGFCRHASGPVIFVTAIKPIPTAMD